MPRAIGQPLIRLGKTSYSTTAGDYYGIGFGYAPTLTDKNCCEIGCIIGDKTGAEYGDLVFSTRPNTGNTVALERMRIKYDGDVNISSLKTFNVYLSSGSAYWNNFTVTTSSLWGDGLTTASDQGGTQYITMRSMMFQNPHVVPNGVGANVL